uniref:LTI65/LTI78 PGEED repeat domain-containing protein n=1 Tax=Ananas comosus var. bracteatus TaxID=296719 RepID=A0A6V7NLF4_ANACO|nr:unnamed protein product [Ananas comosus var. bracteatus]
MAETQGMRFGGGTPRGEHHLAGKNPFDDEDDMHGQYWPTPTTPAFGFGYDHEYEHDHHAKKSVLGKARARRRKLDTPWGVSLDEDDDDEEDPEYHGAPMYESEMAPEMYKKAEPTYCSKTYTTSNWNKESEMKEANDIRKEPKLHHLNSLKKTSTAVPLVTDKHSLSDKPMNSVRGMNNPNNKTMSEMVTEILVPAYNIITEATYNIASKIQDAGPRYEAGAKQMWDKGIAVKEYLVHKLEPGEDDRALCEVITEAVSPRSDGRNQAEEKGSFVEKMRVAASSLHGQEESQGSPIRSLQILTQKKLKLVEGNSERIPTDVFRL